MFHFIVSFVFYRTFYSSLVAIDEMFTFLKYHFNIEILFTFYNLYIDKVFAHRNRGLKALQCGHVGSFFALFFSAIHL